MASGADMLSSSSGVGMGNAVPLATRRMAKAGAEGLPDEARSGAFRDVLGGVMDKDKELQLRAKIRDVSQKYVAQSLVQPLLKQARELRDDSPPFGATQAEKQFGSMMDERTALDMVQRGNWNLVGNIERRLLRAAGLEKPPVMPAPQTEQAGGDQ